MTPRGGAAPLDGASEGGGDVGSTDRRNFHGRGVCPAGHREPLVGVQEDRRTGTAEPADHLLLAVRQVRRRAGVGRAAAAFRRRGPDQLRHHRVDRRHRAVRARPQPAFRDVRHPADQGRHHRRAALDRLGPPFGADQGPRRRAGLHPSGGDAPAHAERGRGGSRARDERRRLPQSAAQDLNGRRDGTGRGVRGGDRPSARPWARPCPMHRVDPSTPSRPRSPRRL